MLESPLDCEEIQPVHPKGMNIQDWCWSWNSSTLATWCEELTHLKRPWCWERLKVGEGDDRGWDDWMASLTQWTGVWVNSRSWQWTGRPEVFASGHLKILFCREAILGSKLPRWLSDKEPACQCRECRRRGFDPWVREDPLKEKVEAPPIFLRGKSHGQKNLAGCSPWGPKSVGHNLMTECVCSVWKPQNITKQCQLKEAYHSDWEFLSYCSPT